MPTAVTARAAAARLVTMRFALVCALLATLASAAHVDALLTDAQSVRVQSAAVQSAAVQSADDNASVAYVPHFAGLPCADSGSCPWGPNCTVCGNYCGAGWCGGSCVPEGDSCDFSVEPQAMSCTDACCKAHDMCCGCYDAGSADCDKSGCNKLLAACLSNCAWNDKCSGPDGTWGPKLLQLVFVLDQRQCCGSRCPNDPPDPPSFSAIAAV